MRIVIIALFFLLAGTAVRADQIADSAGRYKIDPASQLRFSVAQVGGGGIEGRFTRFSGIFSLDGQNIARSKVDFVLQADGIDVADPRIADFIRSDAVFNAAKYPEIIFRSTRIRKTGANTAHVEGNLTARGMTRIVGLEVEFQGREGRVIRFRAAGRMSRALFGMEVGTPIYSNMVVLDLDIAGKRM